MSRPELSRIGSRLEVLHTPRRRCDDRNEKSYVLRVDRSMSREYGCGCIVDTSNVNVQGVGEEKESEKTLEKTFSAKF